MTFEEFEIYFWAYINENIITPSDRNNVNKSFCDAVCYDSFRLYEQSNVSIDTVCKQAENILFSVHRFKPVLGSN